jgi:molybdopterin-guanine dinucleotide biosynthesis protein A
VASAAILAGGRATRYGGRDKGGLLVGGRPILERQLAELSGVTDDLMVVVGAGPDRPLPDGAVARVVYDRVADCGPLGGLEAALEAARDDVVVVVAGDMPFVTAALARYLVSLAWDAEAVVPRTERGYHPLCAAYTRGCRAAVAGHLRARRLRMIDLLHAVRVREVSAAEIDALGDHHRLLANVNTPAEHDAIDALFGHEL